MPNRTRSIIFGILTSVFCILAVICAALAVHLVLLGAYPAAGEGSLGHVGIVVAGLAAGLLSVLFALLGLYTGLRLRRKRQ